MRGKLGSCFVPLFLLFFYVVQVPVVDATIRIMPLGDSITRGSSSGAIPDDQAFYVSYRKALWDNLEAAGYVTDFVGSQIGGSAIPDFDPDHEGHGGWRDDEILNGRKSEPNKGKLIEWLINNQPDIVLLHIGTNGVESSPDDIEAILEIIDFYSVDVWVVLARIINRSCITDDPSCSESVKTTTFNNNTTTMAQNRIDNLGDKIILVDMEDGAGIDYFAFPAGDMWDNLHPYETGYLKMADLWFSALDQILQSVDGTNVVLDYIEIEGPPILNENSRANYYCRAYYTNGTNRLVMANNWNEDSLFTDISNMGNLITEEVFSDESVEIYASYSEGNITKNTTYDVIVRDLFTYNLQSRVSQTGSVSQGEWVYYQIEASASDADILVELTNLSANVDLYVLAGFMPTLTDYDCRPSQSGTTSETCIVQNSVAITWYIGVHGYQTGSFTITATLPIFNDVPLGHWADDAIYTIYNDGITKGCSTDPLLYCPDRAVSKAAMAVFLLRSIHGGSYTPPPATGIFTDVDVNHWSAPWVEQLYNEGITQGCSSDPLMYCPDRAVSKASMAAFLLRAIQGGSYTPPPATGIFTDVDVNHWSAPWVEELYNEGITKGCSSNPLMYCPDRDVSRAAMALFLVRTFGL